MPSTRTRAKAPAQHPATTPPLPDTAVPDGFNPAVPVDEIDPNPMNVRRDLGDLDELAASIATSGIRHPLTVSPVHQVDGGDRYVLIDGHRRYAAARLAGLTTVPAIVRTGLTGDVEVLVEMLTAGLLQERLSPVEEAAAYTQLELLGLKPAEIAKRVGRARSTVEQRLHLMDLPEAVRERVHTRAITLDEAAVIAEFAELADRWAAARDWVKTLEAEAGGRDWAYTVGRARQAWEGERKRQAARGLVAALGVQLLQGGGVDRSWMHVQRTWYTEAELTEAASDDGAPIAGIDEVPTEARAHLGCPDAAAQVSLGGYVTWYCLRPEQHTPVRGTGAAADAVDEQLGEPASAGTAVPYVDFTPDLARAQTELRAAWYRSEEPRCLAAAEARQTWIREVLMPGRKPFSTRQSDALAVFLARNLVAYSVEVDVADWLYWLGVDIDGLLETGVIDDAFTDQRLEELLRRHIDTARDPQRVVLAAFASEQERPSECGGVLGWVRPDGALADVRAWLQLLTALGYEPCSWEAEYLADRTGTCRVCGCTEDAACTTDPLSSCWWVVPDLCSSCARKAIAEAAEAAAGEEDAGEG